MANGLYTRVGNEVESTAVLEQMRKNQARREQAIAGQQAAAGAGGPQIASTGPTAQPQAAGGAGGNLSAGSSGGSFSLGGGYTGGTAGGAGGAVTGAGAPPRSVGTPGAAGGVMLDQPGSAGWYRRQGQPSQPGGGGLYQPGQVPPQMTGPAGVPGSPVTQQLDTLRSQLENQQYLAGPLPAPPGLGPSTAPVPKLAAPTMSEGVTGQQQALVSRLQELLAGRAPDIGDVNNDPEARAYRVAKERQAALARQEEADRLGASGVTGSGDFDARVAGIREATGEAVASQVASLAGRRRKEAQDAALAGAGLTMSNLGQTADRDYRERRAQYDVGADTADRESRERLAQYGAASDQYRTQLDQSETRRREQLQLLEAQMAEQARLDQLARTAPGTDLQNILLQQEILKNKGQVPSPYPTYMPLPGVVNNVRR